MNILQLIVSPANYSITIHGIFLLIATGVAIVIGVTVLVRDQLSPTSRLYFYYTLLDSIWFLGFCLATGSKHSEMAQFWIKFGHIGIIFIPAVIFHIVIRALDLFKSYKKNIVLNWILSSLLLLFVFMIPGYFGKPYVYKWGFYPKYSYYSILFIIYVVYILFLISFIIKRYYKKTKEDVDIRLRFQISLLAIIIGGFAVIDFLPAFGINIYPIGYLFLLIGIILSAYVAWRYRFINIFPTILMERILESISEAVLIIDKSGTIRYVNKAACKNFGFPEESLLWKPLNSVFKDKDFTEYLLACLGKKNSSNEEVTYTDPKGKKIELILSFTRIYDYTNKHISTVFLCYDITKYKKIQAQLSQIQKLDSISSLTSNISHNFNNLLTIINGYAEICLLKLGDKHPISSRIKVIHDAGMKAENLIRQLSAFSQNQKIDVKTINVNQIIIKSKLLLEHMIGSNIKIETHLSPKSISIIADPIQFEQILINMIKNAKETFLEEKNPGSDRKIIIKTDRQNANDRIKIIEPKKHHKQYAVISFIDNGVGFEEKDIEKIFEPFYTTKSDETGAGLRLAAVYGIVKQNRGFMFVSSQADQGARLEIFWPIITKKTSGRVSRGKKKI
jgi:PAS domain S-box-containing protein